MSDYAKSFTDDDIENFIEALAHADPDRESKDWHLLARLAAAEKVCEQMDYFLRHGTIDSEYNSDEYKAWLRACGKSKGE